MSIFCKHSYILLSDTIQNHVWGKLPFDAISLRVKIICTECGKIKEFETESMCVEPYYRLGGFVLNDEQRLQMDIYRNKLAKKMEKKYGITIDSIWQQ